MSAALSPLPQGAFEDSRSRWLPADGFLLSPLPFQRRASSSAASLPGTHVAVGTPMKSPCPKNLGRRARRRPTGNNTDILTCPVFEAGVCLFVPEPMDRLRALNPGISHPSRLSLLTWKWPSTGGVSAGCWPGCRARNTHSVPLGETLSPALESQHEASNLYIWTLPVKLEVLFYRFKRGFVFSVLSSSTVMGKPW